MNIHPLNDIEGYKAKNKPEAILMYSLGFTEEDLADNQQGKMSIDQRLRCSARRHWWLAGGIFCVVGFLIVWFGGGRLAVVLMLFAFFGFICFLNAYRFYTDATKGMASTVEGRVNLLINGRRYSVVVENMKFDLKQKAFLAFKNGDPYRVYYTPKTKVLLSAEWLRD